MSRASYRIALYCSFAAGGIVNGILWLGVWKGFPPSELPYITRYSVIAGADVFGTQQDLFLIPALGLFLISLNAILARIFIRRERLLALVSAAWSFLVQLFLLVVLAALLLFNARI